MKFEFLRIESFKRGIVLSSVFGFLSKSLIFFQSVAIAYYFGAKIETDIYFYCYAAISLLAAFISNLDISVLVPEAMRLDRENGRAASNAFLNFFIGCYVLMGLAFAMATLISPVDIFTIVTNFNAENLEANREILLMSIPLFGLMVITNLMGGILSSLRFFTIPMIVGSINGIVVLIFLFLFHARFGILSVLIGHLVAYTGSILFLAFLMKTNLKWEFSIMTFRLEKRIWSNIIFAQAGNLATTFSSYVPLFLLSSFGSGTITSLTYGQRIAELPNQLISAQVSSVVGIQFNGLYASRNLELLSSIFKTTVRLLLFLLIPISCFVGLYSYEIVVVLFERGAFSVNSAQNVSEFLRYFGFLLPSLFINTIVARLFMATQKIRQAFWYQIVLNVLSIIMIVVLVDRMGTIGYPVALLVVGAANICFCYVLVKRLFPFIDYGDVLEYLLKVLCFNGVISAVIFLLKPHFISDNALIQVVFGFVFYVTVILVANSILNLNSDVKRFVKLSRGSSK